MVHKNVVLQEGSGLSYDGYKYNRVRWYQYQYRYQLAISQEGDAVFTQIMSHQWLYV